MDKWAQVVNYIQLYLSIDASLTKGPATRNYFVNDIVNVSSSTFHRRRWNIVDIVDDEPATRNDNVNDADVK